MKTPHLLNASSNCRKLLKQLGGILNQSSCDLIEIEIQRNTKAMFQLGQSHFLFAKSLNRSHWRQKVSRYYYGAYNAKRAVGLFVDGSYKTDVSDHKNIDSLPTGFPNIQTYSVQLGVLRDDRNLADYDHEATESDLIISINDAETLVDGFINDAIAFLANKGIQI